MKSKFSKSAEIATNELQEKMPPAISSVMNSLPPRVKAATGSALVAGRSAKKIAKTTALTTKVTRSGVRKASDKKKKVKDKLDTLKIQKNI